MQSTPIDKFVKDELADLPKERRVAVREGLTDLWNGRATRLQEEMIFGASRRERRAWGLVALALVVAGGGVGLGLWGMSQTETHAYLTIVDKDTGIAQRAVTVERAVLDQSDAVLQSLVHGYIMDRETFDENDNEPRILDVFRRSSGRARRSLQQIWDKTYPDFRASVHPPNVYGKSGKVSVDVINITQITDKTMQVRFTKTLKTAGEATREGKFVAVVTYVFKPETRDNLELVWENPFGFYVTDYRVTSEVSIDD